MPSSCSETRWAGDASSKKTHVRRFARFSSVLLSARKGCVWFSSRAPVHQERRNWKTSRILRYHLLAGNRTVASFKVNEPKYWARIRVLIYTYTYIYTYNISKNNSCNSITLSIVSRSYAGYLSYCSNRAYISSYRILVVQWSKFTLHPFTVT